MHTLLDPVIIPENRRVSNWTFPAFDEHGENNEKIEIC